MLRARSNRPYPSFFHSVDHLIKLSKKLENQNKGKDFFFLLLNDIICRQNLSFYETFLLPVFPLSDQK